MRFWKPRHVPGHPLVTVVAAAYAPSSRLQHACLAFVHCMLGQTYQNIELLLMHDGPMKDELKRWLPRDSRLHLIENEFRLNQHGHPQRVHGISVSKGAYIGLANADCWYVPVYIEWLVSELIRHKADIAFCDMIHSHHLWRPFETKFKKSRLDVGAWIARGDLVRSTPWTDYGFSGDGTFIDAMAAKANKTTKVKAFLYTHN